MAAPTWLSYVGAITGIVGMITGVTGAILGWVGYRRSVRVRVLDLRLQLRRAANELRSIVDALPNHLSAAHQSRKNVSATGYLGGAGNMETWRHEWDYDVARATELTSLAPGGDVDFTELSEAEIETKHVEIHALALECTRLQEKYSAAMAADDRVREEIRARMARIGG